MGIEESNEDSHFFETKFSPIQLPEENIEIGQQTQVVRLVTQQDEKKKITIEENPQTFQSPISVLDTAEIIDLRNETLTSLRDLKQGATTEAITALLNPVIEEVGVASFVNEDKIALDSDEEREANQVIEEMNARHQFKHN